MAKQYIKKKERPIFKDKIIYDKMINIKLKHLMYAIFYVYSLKNLCFNFASQRLVYQKCDRLCLFWRSICQNNLLSE